MPPKDVLTATSKGLWHFCAELEEVAMRAETLGLGAGPIRRMSVNVGELAAAIEKRESRESNHE